MAINPELPQESTNIVFIRGLDSNITRLLEIESEENLNQYYESFIENFANNHGGEFETLETDCGFAVYVSLNVRILVLWGKYSGNSAILRIIHDFKCDRVVILRRPNNFNKTRFLCRASEELGKVIFLTVDAPRLEMVEGAFVAPETHKHRESPFATVPPAWLQCRFDVKTKGIKAMRYLLDKSVDAFLNCLMSSVCNYFNIFR